MQTPDRRKPEMPSEPGAYEGKGGRLIVRDATSDGHCWWDFSDPETPCYTDAGVAKFAPFTRLVPMPTVDSVHAAVYNALRGSGVDGMYPLRTTDAVMALLTGKEADSE